MQTHPYKHDAEQAIRGTDLVLVPIITGKTTEWAALSKEEAAPILAKVRTALGPLNIELRKIHYAAFASEETNCFDAEIWINGKKEGRAHNDGHGGMTSIDPHSLSQKLDIYGATLPREVTSIADDSDPTGFFTMQPDAENIVDDLLEKHLRAKDAEKEAKKLQRDLQCRIVYTVKGKKGIYQTKKLDPARIKAVLEKRLIPDADVILNLLPFAEAKKVFDANITRVYR